MILLVVFVVFLLVLAIGGAIFDRLFPDEWWDARRRNR